MEKTRRTPITKVLSIIFVMFAAYVGPGFASGAQTVSYFLNKGWIGVFIGPAIVGILCFAFTFLLFEINRIYKPNTSREAYDIIYQKKGLRLFFGNFKEVQVIVVILIALSADVSTVGLLLNSVLGLNIWIGAFLFVILLLSVSLFGSSVFRRAGTVLAICLLGVSLYIGVTRLPASMGKMLQFVNSGQTYHAFGYSSGFIAWFSMLTIIVFFMNGYDSCVHASRGIVNSRRDVWLISIGTALLTTGITMMFTVIFAAGMPGILKVQVPTLWAMTSLVSSNIAIQLLYVLFAVAAMTSSSMSFLFTVDERFQNPIKKLMPHASKVIRKLVISLTFVIICTGLSSFGLLNIIKYGYTIFTMFVGPIMFLPLFISVPYRIIKDHHKNQAETITVTDSN